MNKKEILLLSLALFITVMIWVVADVYHASTEDKVKVKIDLPQVYHYKIDQKLFQTLKSKSQ